MRLILLLTLLAGGSVALRVAAQVPGSLDTNYVTVPGSDTIPAVLVPATGGQLYVGGAFTNYGGTGRASLARLTPTGAVDPDFTLPRLVKVIPPVIVNNQVLVPGSTNAGNVAAALLLPDGRPVIAGPFSHVGATPAPGVAVLNTDGSFAAAPGDVSKIEAKVLLAGPGGTFHVGGGGNVDDTRLPLLRFHPDGSRDNGFTPPTWASLGYLGSSAGILLRGPGETIYVVTAAVLANFTQGADILRLTADGALDPTFADAGKAAVPLPSFSSFATSPAGQMTFAGVTTYRGAALSRKINRLTSEGALDATFNASVDPGFGGRVVAVQADGKVLYTGSPNALNRLQANGSVDPGYANPAKVPVAQTLMALMWVALGLDQSTYAGGYTLGPNFTLLNGVYHVFGDPNSAPTIASQPIAQTNTLGARTRFSVTAQGAAPLSFQWFRNGTPIGGATSADLVLPATVATDAAAYHCTVSNGQGGVDSAVAHLTLLDPTPGSVYRETDVPVGPDGGVSDLRFDAAEGLLGTGGFVKWNQTNRVRLARLLPGAAMVDPGFDTSTLGGTLLQAFDHVLPLASGKVLAVGTLNVTYNGKAHAEVLRFNANGSVDTSFNPDGTGGSGTAGSLGTHPAEDASGRLILYGHQWNGESLGGSYFRLDQNGTRDTSFALRGGGYLPFGPVIAAWPDGRYLVAGRPVGSSPPTQSSGVLRLLADGTPDPTFFTGNLPAPFRNDGIRDILVQPDGRILVGGTFSFGVGVDSVAVGVIRLLPDGQPDPEFLSVPRLANPGNAAFVSVGRLALQADGRIVVVGTTQTGSFPRNQLFRLWPSGLLDPSFDVGINANQSGTPALLALAVRPDNALFVGGAFTEFAGFARTNFVRVNGGPLQPTPAPPTITSVPLRVVARAGTNLTLVVEPGGSGPYQFQWRRNEGPGSTNFHDLVGATNASVILPNLRVADSGLLQVTVVNPGGAVTSPYLTLLVEPDPAVPGQVDRSFVAPGFSGNLTGLHQISAVNPDGTVYAALGDSVIRLFEDGTRDVSFAAAPLARLDTSTANGISAILRQPDGKLLVAGRLTFDGGPCNIPGATCFEPKRGLVRLLPEGSFDPDFVQTNAFAGGAQNIPHVLGLQRDGKILVAGTFDNFSGRTVTGLVRLLPSGEVDDTFPLGGIDAVVPNPPRTLPGTVVSLHVLPDDRIYIGGGFSRVHGMVRHGVARLKPDGTLDDTFVPPTNGAVAAGTAGTMLFYQMGPVTPQRGLYIFGEFLPGQGQPRQTALRLLENGGIDATFQLVTDFQVNTGAVQPDGKLIISGQFTTVQGSPHGNLARLNPDGSLDGTFQNTATGAGVGVQLTLLPDGKLLAASTRYFTGTGPVAPPTELAVTLTAEGLQLSWLAGYRLQRTASLVPANWQDVIDASPLTVPTTAPGGYFRLVQTP